MNVLSIDTTAEICSLALKCGDQFFCFHEERPREHAKITLPQIEILLKHAEIQANDLDHIVLGRGPGSFTGVRIAAGIAQGLAFSANCQILPVSTLMSLAYSVENKVPGQVVWSALDARMSEIYFAPYCFDDQGLPVELDEECVLPPSKLETVPSDSIVFVGNGWKTDYSYPEAIQNLLLNNWQAPQLPNAQISLELALALLAEERISPVEAEDAIPVYLRDKVTWDNKPKVGS
jgi:tRNA threonylcarbamoyladenosine biosynthesis protein TsaB